MVLLHFSSDEFLRLGLEWTGREEWRQKNSTLESRVEKYRAAYGVDPGTCTVIFVDLQTANDPNARIEKPSPKFLLLTLNWLRVYGTEKNRAGLFGVAERTARDQAWLYTLALQALKGQKVCTMLSHYIAVTMYILTKFILTVSFSITDSLELGSK